MAIYVIVDIDVRNPEAYEEYTAKVSPLVAKHGGTFLVRGGEHEVMVGDWQPTRLVVFRYPSREALEAFSNDPENQPDTSNYLLGLIFSAIKTI